MKRLYDLMLMLDPDAPDGRHGQILDEVGSMIEKGGDLVGRHDWGDRRMTFEIDHHPDAAYHLFQFESEPSLLERLDHSLKIADGVLRFRIIRLKPGTPPPPPPRAEAPRPREEETETTTVAARAAADAPAEPSADVAADAPAEPAADVGPSAPAADAPADAPAEAPAEASADAEAASADAPASA